MKDTTISICYFFFFFFKQKTAYEIGLGIPAEPLFRSLNNPYVSRPLWPLLSSFRLLPFWIRSEERFSRNAETDLVCRLLLEKKKTISSCTGDGRCIAAKRYVHADNALGDRAEEGLAEK